MTLNLNLGLFLITQNHVFPSSWPVWVESLYFDLHYKYMFYNNCYTCALYIVHHYDISYLTPFVFLFYKKGWIKAISPPPPLSPPSPVVPVYNTWIAMRFGFLGLPIFFLAVDIQTDGQGARCWVKRCPSLAEARQTLEENSIHHCAGGCRERLPRRAPRGAGAGSERTGMRRPGTWEPGPAAPLWGCSCSCCS